MQHTVCLDGSPVRVVGVEAPDLTPVSVVAQTLRDHWGQAGSGWRLESMGYAASGRRIEAESTWGSLEPGSLILTREPAPPLAHGDLRLAVLTGPDAGRIIPVGAGRLSIGRGPGHDVALGDPLVSREATGLMISARGVGLGSRFTRLGAVIHLGSSTLRVTSAAHEHSPPEPWSTVPPARPADTEPRRLFLAGFLAPVVIAIVLAVVTSTWLFLIIAAASPLTGTLTWWLERRHTRRSRVRDEARWLSLDREARRQVAESLEAARLASYSKEGMPLGIGAVRAQIDIEGPWPSAPPQWREPAGARRWRPAMNGAALVITPEDTAVALTGGSADVLAVARSLLCGRHPSRWEVVTATPEDFSFLSPFGLTPVDAHTPVAEGALRLVDTPVGSRREIRILAAGRAEAMSLVQIDLGEGGHAGVEAARLLPGAPEPFIPGPIAVGAMSVSTWLSQREAAPGAETGHGCVSSALESLVPLGETQLRRRWAAPPEGARVVIGRTSDGLASLDLVAQGPHALVGGTTGSGKSQFLETLAVSLAAAEPPERLTLLLVDFKGGSAFRRIAGLPHVAGMLTNLDAHATSRAIRALDAELRRRQRLFADHGAKDLDECRVIAPALAPPRLVIIVDEFRALAQTLPELMESLVALAGLGRSLGMHLILATQRPSGVVTADMRANIGLRVALRMRDQGDSLDVLESPLAASISAASPGRGYFRADAEPEKEFHAALVQGSEDDTPPGIRLGPPRLHTGTPVGAGTAFSAAAFRAAADGGRAPQLWLPELADHVPYSSDAPCTAAMADDPEQQRQYSLDLSGAGHTALIGSPRSGRSRGLATLLRSGAHATPQVAWYIIDVDRQLGNLGTFDQCAALVPGDEAWRVDRLLAFLTEEIRRRLHAGVAEPPVTLVVDGWESFSAQADEARKDWVTQVASIARSGTACGVRLLVSGDRKLMSSRLGHTIGTVLAFRHHDPQDLVFLGLSKSDVPHRMPPGRALLLGAPGETHRQSPLLVHLVNDESIPAVSDPTTRSMLRPLPSAPRRPERRAGDVPLGVGGDAAEPLNWTPEHDGRALLVVAPAGSAYLCEYWTHAAPAARVIELAALTRTQQAEALIAETPVGEGAPIIVTAGLDTLLPSSPLLAEINRRGSRLLLGATHPSQGEGVGRRDLTPLPDLPGRGWYLHGAQATPIQLYAHP